MWWQEYDQEISAALGRHSLRSALTTTVEAYEFIRGSWDPETYLIRPWWVWKEIQDPVFVDQPPVLHLNLVGLLLFGLGIEPDPEEDLALVRPPRALLENDERELDILLDTVPHLSLRCYRRIAAIDLIRTDWHVDYAIRLWGGYTVPRTERGMPDPRRRGRNFVDESVTRPDRLMARIYDLTRDHRMRGV